MRDRIEPLSSRRLLAAVFAVLVSIGATAGWVAYENSRAYRILAACSGPLPASLRPPCVAPPPIILPFDPLALTWSVLVGPPSPPSSDGWSP